MAHILDIMKKGVEIIPRYDLTCSFCKKEHRSTMKLQYCSRECYYKSRPKGRNEQQQTCICCGSKFESYNSNKRKYCSRKCFYDSTWQSRTERALEIRGKGNSHWTWYKDIHFRSTWEAHTAELLDSAKIVWKYEETRFDLKTGRVYTGSLRGKKEAWTYLPDFYLPEFNIWLEVKGWMRPNDQEKIDRFRELGYNLVIVRGDDIGK